MLLPVVVLVTDTVTVQPVVGTLPPVTFKVVTPTPALLTTPVQVPPTVAEDKDMPAGRVSLNVSAVTPAPVELLIEKVIVEVPPKAIDVGANALVIPSRPTVNVADAVVPVPPFVDVTAVVVLM